MSSPLICPLVDGTRLVVPDALDLITPYVLREQQDWFEDEIKFLRRWLQPGQQVIDIGANYGVYTVSMAQAVGAQGRVWAFEPASSTAQWLAQSVALNAMPQVTLDQRALSSHVGTAQLSLNDNAELNALVRGASAHSACETVPLVTLDSCLAQYGWRDIDFLKIDAEGEEMNILLGGAHFFSALSPLVQYEIKVDGPPDLQLVRRFEAMGYASYRLVPGLDVLVPFDPATPPDAYQLNLFCCKPDRAAQLAEAQFLVLPGQPPGPPAATRLADLLARHPAQAPLPYQVQCAQTWAQATAHPSAETQEVLQALALYQVSQDTRQTAVDRFWALDTGFQQIQQVCERQASHLRMASLARIARACGARTVAVSALGQLCDLIFQEQRVDASEPFVPPCPRYDAMAPGSAVGNWVLASALEELERLVGFSSFYTGLSSRQRLETFLQLGVESPEMARRLQLLQERFHLPTAA